MKTHATLIVLSLLFPAFCATAQDTRVHLPVSKQVQYISNQQWILSGKLLTVSSVGYPTWTISKDVMLISNRIVKQPSRANMISTGYSEQAISKGVHAIARRVPSGKERGRQ
ncbi:MAG TPA: hypothetical protein VF490_08720 [Chryseosolibacter sp.]